MGLSGPTMQALTQHFKYTIASEVQAKAVPVAMGGTDVLARARTGTGKTLAFLLPAFERIKGQFWHLAFVLVLVLVLVLFLRSFRHCVA
jgi:superfamily II DNA/RNA helicase